MAHMVGTSGKVIGIEHIPQLVEISRQNLAKDATHRKWMEERKLQIVQGDGRKGYPEGGPYDAIHVGAAAPTMPLPLIEQLKSPGRLFIPVGKGEQQIIQVDKDKDGKVTQTRGLSVMVKASDISFTNCSMFRYATRLDLTTTFT